MVLSHYNINLVRNLSSFPHKSHDEWSYEEKFSNEEEEKEDVMVLRLPSYLQMLQRSRQDRREEPIMAS